jgi:hypothetical protein
MSSLKFEICRNGERKHQNPPCIAPRSHSAWSEELPGQIVPHDLEKPKNHPEYTTDDTRASVGCDPEGRDRCNRSESGGPSPHRAAT